ncbi:hypothetical protein F4X88_16205 [Candidatus Poribacteria bacterium]|nr:hypothetical protein [Candidatus Poribacteria bacterium]
MFKNSRFGDIFSSRSLLAGFVFFLLCVGSSFLYNWHVRRTTQDELAQSSVLLQLERKNKTRPAADAVDTSPVDFEQAETFLEPVETLPPMLTQMPQNDAEFKVPPELEMDVVEPSELSPEVAAPFDFKTTPSGYPLTPYWDRSMELQEQLSYEHKLIDHVLVKLWNQDVRDFVGGSIGKNGRVHPHYVNTLYVKWKEIRYPDGTLGPVISKSFGGGDVRFEQKDIFDLPPPNVRLIDLDSSEGQGIDPYAFLTSQELP